MRKPINILNTSFISVLCSSVFWVFTRSHVPVFTRTDLSLWYTMCRVYWKHSFCGAAVSALRVPSGSHGVRRQMVACLPTAVNRSRVSADVRSHVCLSSAIRGWHWLVGGRCWILSFFPPLLPSLQTSWRAGVSIYSVCVCVCSCMCVSCVLCASAHRSTRPVGRDATRHGNASNCCLACCWPHSVSVHSICLPPYLSCHFSISIWLDPFLFCSLISPLLLSVSVSLSLSLCFHRLSLSFCL